MTTGRGPRRARSGRAMLVHEQRDGPAVKSCPGFVCPPARPTLMRKANVVGPRRELGHAGQTRSVNVSRSREREIEINSAAARQGQVARCHEVEVRSGPAIRNDGEPEVTLFEDLEVRLLENAFQPFPPGIVPREGRPTRQEYR